MATSKSGSSRSSSTRRGDNDPAGEKELADAQEAEQAIVDEGHVSPDHPDAPEPPGDVKITGELVTDDTAESMEQARRNANINPTTEDFNQ